MRLTNRMLALFVTLALLCSLLPAGMPSTSAAMLLPNPNYQRPDMSIAEMPAPPRIDGVLEDTWQNVTSIEFTENALKESGLIWTYSEDGLLFNPLPDVGGTAYVGWDETYFYFALEVSDEEHVNNQSDTSMLWQGDCLMMQIGPDASLFASDTDPGICSRYELGFALSTFTQNRRLGYKWYPEPGEALATGSKQDMSKADGDDYYYYVGRDDENTKTIYEVALKYSFFGRSEAMEPGDVIPFSFALHINESNPVSDTDNGSFMEWAQGIAGSDLEKNITSAARLTLEDTADDETPSPVNPPPSNEKQYEQEPNNSVDAPNAIPLNTPISGNIGVTNDFDYFSFKLEEDGYVTVNFQHEALKTGEWHILLPDGNSQQFVYDETDVTTRRIGLPAGKYYLYVYSSDRTCAGVEYLLTVNFTPTNTYEQEPNDREEAPNAIPLDTPIGGNIGVANKFDYFSFKLEEDGYVTVNFQHEALKTGEWHILLPDGSRMTSTYDDTSTHSQRLELSAGKHYLYAYSSDKTCVGVEYLLTLQTNAALFGDVNGDDKVNTTDARQILQYAAGILGEADLNLDVADVTGDGKVNTTDARSILQFAAGIIDHFPAEDM